MIMWASARATAAPPMSFFMISMAEAGLMSSPPVSKRDALADERDLGRVWAATGLVPIEFDQARGTRARAADGVDHGKVLQQKIIADDGADRCAMECCDGSHGGFDLGGPKVACGRVDEVATEPCGFDGVGEACAIDVWR